MSVEDGRRHGLRAGERRAALRCRLRAELRGPGSRAPPCSLRPRGEGRRIGTSRTRDPGQHASPRRTPRRSPSPPASAGGRGPLHAASRGDRCSGSPRSCPLGKPRESRGAGGSPRGPGPAVCRLDGLRVPASGRALSSSPRSRPSAAIAFTPLHFLFGSRCSPLTTARLMAPRSPPSSLPDK